MTQTRQHNPIETGREIAERLGSAVDKVRIEPVLGALNAASGMLDAEGATP